MAKRKDTKNHVLLQGETFCIKNGKEMYCFRWTDPTGKRHAIYSIDLKELRLKERDVNIERIDGLQHAGNLKINDMYQKWKSIKKGLKENTFRNYRYMYEAFVEPTFGKMKIKDLKKSDVRKFYIDLHEKRGMKVHTIDMVHVVLYQVLELALEDGYLRNNPARNAMTELKRIRKEEEKRIALSIEEQALFEKCLTYEENKWVQPIFMVMLEGGLRVGEATGLRWEDIDLEKKLINVNHTLVYYDHGKESASGTKCYYGINTPKTKNSIRLVPMTTRLISILYEYKAYVEKNDLRCATVVDGYSDFAFFNTMNKTVFNQAVLNKRLKRIQRDCNLSQIDLYGNEENTVLLTNFTCHNLRHTAATRLCESGMNTRVIMDIMGHADIRTTMNIYVDVKEQMKYAELDKFEKYMSENKNEN